MASTAPLGWTTRYDICGISGGISGVGYLGTSYIFLAVFSSSY